MKQSVYGLMLYAFLMIPPIVKYSEIEMIVHMHMQMTLFVFSGILMARFFQIRFSNFFEKWNQNGVPGIILVVMIWTYWMIPRAMDDALTQQSVEIFKFISLPFLVGVPLRDSWGRLGSFGKNMFIFLIAIIFIVMSIIYITADSQLCNNYLVDDQKGLGWGTLFIGAGMIVYLIQSFFVDQSEYK